MFWLIDLSLKIIGFRALQHYVDRKSLQQAITSSKEALADKLNPFKHKSSIHIIIILQCLFTIFLQLMDPTNIKKLRQNFWKLWWSHRKYFFAIFLMSPDCRYWERGPRLTRRPRQSITNMLLNKDSIMDVNN